MAWRQQHLAAPAGEPVRCCSLCRHPVWELNPACPACWCRAHPRPDDDPIYEAAEIAEKAREKRLADLARHDDPVLVGLLSCGKAKQPGRHPARDLYTSPLFRTSLAYLEATCHEVYILSAKHGLIEPGAVVERYEQRLPQRAEELRCWARNVETTLRLRFVNENGILPVRIIALAGKGYIEPLRSCLDWAVDWTLPLDGMTIFERQHWASQWWRAQT